MPLSHTNASSSLHNVCRDYRSKSTYSSIPSPARVVSRKGKAWSGLRTSMGRETHMGTSQRSWESLVPVRGLTGSPFTCSGCCGCCCWTAELSCSWCSVSWPASLPAYSDHQKKEKKNFHRVRSSFFSLSHAVFCSPCLLVCLGSGKVVPCCLRPLKLL